MKPSSTLILLAMLVFLTAGDALFAWTAPGALPPSDNVAAPLHVGAASQVKSGGIGVGSLDVAGGALVRGTANTNDVDLTVQGKVGATEYCDVTGTNCTDLANPSTGGGIGYDQEWTVVNRTQGVWYRNGTGKPIMVFHKNIWSGTIIDVGASTSTAVRLNYQDYDSDLDNGSTTIIPPGHYYRFGTRTENNPNDHYSVRELR